MSTMICQIQIRNVFGIDKAYPTNETANNLAMIANTKTLTRRTLTLALAMGMSLQVVDRYGQISKTFDRFHAAYEMPAIE